MYSILLLQLLSVCRVDFDLPLFINEYYNDKSKQWSVIYKTIKRY